jgi:hypothetical protein
MKFEVLEMIFVALGIDFRHYNRVLGRISTGSKSGQGR